MDVLDFLPGLGWEEAGVATEPGVDFGFSTNLETECARFSPAPSLFFLLGMVRIADWGAEGEGAAGLANGGGVGGDCMLLKGQTNEKKEDKIIIPKIRNNRQTEP